MAARGSAPGFLLGRLASLAVALACAAAGFGLAAHYPLGRVAAIGVFAVVVAGMAAWPRAWLVALPGVLPLIGFAPWSGWISFEEFDMLVLALAAGGYARRAIASRAASAHEAPVAGAGVLAALFLASVAVSLARGVIDAGGFRFGWFQGYTGSMNSVRLAKSFLLALLMWPLWRDAQRADPAASSSRWIAGWCLGLAAASLAALWERLAFTGLLDFSSDYRSTALFWEMHVGGSAFDAFLALTVPFAVLELASAIRAWRWSVAAAVLLLASYACLTTFSRGVFLAIPTGLVVLGGLSRLQRRNDAAAPRGSAGLVPAGVLALAYVGAAAWLFPVAGYRGMLALLGLFAVLLRLDDAPPRRLPASVALGLVLATLVAAASRGLPKGAYLAYVAVFAFSGAMSATPRTRWLAAGGALALAAALGAVCLHWGGDAGLSRAEPVMALAAVAILARTGGRLPLPPSWRWQGALMAGLVAASGAVGVMGGGAYMSSRMSTAGEDLQVRVDHWIEGLRTLHSPARRAFGVGLGRYPATYSLLHADTDAPGDYALRDGSDPPVLALSGGKHMIGWGELLRVSQRIRPPRQPAVVELEVRAAQTVELHLEVCEKHLLYSNACLLKQIVQPPTGAAWSRVRATLEGDGVSRGLAYAPRLVVFSIGNGTRDSVLEVRRLRLIDADGTDLLVNGDFSRGMTGWLFTSDHNLLPWHLENIFVHVLFEQGVFGLAVFLAMLASAFWRLAFGAARGHPLAPATAAALAGFLVVGQFDSLLDAPRVAFVFYLLLLQALSLHSPRGA